MKSTRPLTDRKANPPDLGFKPDSPVLTKFLEYLCDVNLTNKDIDLKMMSDFPQLKEDGWHVGSTREKLKLYPVLARTQAEARALLWRELGRSKLDGYRAISDALEAESYDADGEQRPNHDIRLKASDRMLALMGENASPAGAKLNINLQGQDSKILIMSSEGGDLPFPMRQDETDEH